MNNIKSITILFFTIILFSSCALQTGYIQFEGKADEIISSQKIKDFMAQNSNPTIVLRVPFTEERTTQSEPNSYIFNAIEKELVLGGFNLKDRGLFNEVVDKASDIDYKELRELTGTDLLLELVRFETNIKHSTNRIFDKHGVSITVDNATINRPGAAIEFKLILLENNEYGGNYSFYYTPCKGIYQDCECFIGYKMSPKRVYPHINMCKSEGKNFAFERIEQDVLENFIRSGVKHMIDEIKIATSKADIGNSLDNNTLNYYTDPRDGIKYKFVEIGDQIWMAQNLNYATIKGSWCYDNSSKYCELYGRLYNWNTATRVCPEGWHLPTQDDWSKLEVHIGITEESANQQLRFTDNPEAKKLQLNGQSGFDLLMGGWYESGLFDGIENYAYLWLDNSDNNTSASARNVNSEFDFIRHFNSDKSKGYSVRCIKDR